MKRKSPSSLYDNIVEELFYEIFKNKFLRKKIYLYNSKTKSANYFSQKGLLSELIVGIDYLDFTDDTINLAARYGHIEIVKFLFYNRPEKCTEYGLMYAIKNNHFEIFKFIYEKYLHLRNINLLMIAAYHGYLKIIEFLIKEFSNQDNIELYKNRAITYAAYNGKFNSVKFLQEYKF